MTRRANTLMVFVIMTALVVLGVPLIGLILGPGDDRIQPTADSPTAAPSNDETPDPPEADVATLVPEPDFVLATFNVLGHSHTTETGKEPDLDSSPRRLRRALRLLNEAKVDVVGLQELQGPQAREFERTAGDEWRLFHSDGDTENSIAWRRTEWSMLQGRTVAVPYFNGNERQLPVVRLRHRETGVKVWFINVHNPANTLRFPAQEAYRARAIAIERQLAEELSRGPGSVVLMGDFNMRAEAYCYFTKSGVLVSASGESREKPGTEGCQEPTYNGIDWIFGTPDLEFTDWAVRGDHLVEATSDHPLVTVSVGLPG